MAPPKAILLDVGGVCVLSPFLAIRNYEHERGISEGYINFALSRHSPHGFFHRLERGEIGLGEEYYRGLESDLTDPAVWRAFCERQQQQGHAKVLTKASTRTLNPDRPPRIDGKVLFWRMMRVSLHPDPYIFPAIQRLRHTGRYIVGALSNAVVFPAGVRDEADKEWDTHVRLIMDRPSDERQLRHYEGDEAEERVGRKGVQLLEAYRGIVSLKYGLDFFLNSAEIGLRKPDPDVYRHALEKINSVRGGKGETRLGFGDVVFLDDIGENLKPAKALGMDTIKVQVGNTIAAVRRLEELTGENLLGDGDGEGGNGRGKARL